MNKTDNQTERCAAGGYHQYTDSPYCDKCGKPMGEYFDAVKSIIGKNKKGVTTTKSDNQIIAEEIGIKWHEYKLAFGPELSTCSCGRKGMYVRDICTKANPDFSTPEGFFKLLPWLFDDTKHEWTIEEFLKWRCTNCWLEPDKCTSQSCELCFAQDITKRNDEGELGIVAKLAEFLTKTKENSHENQENENCQVVSEQGEGTGI